MFEYTLVETWAQANSLPIGMLIWIRMLAVVNIASVFWLRHIQARWILAAIVFIIAINMPMLRAGTGLIKLLGVPHVIVWVPLIIYLAVQFRSGALDFQTRLGKWCVAVMMTNLVSVVFDIRDGFQYWMGDRDPMVVDLSAGLPYYSLTAIVIGAIAVLTYAFGTGYLNQTAREQV
jgi:hypothetical protein